jgi:PAS domain S-box-containing protein
MLWVAAPDGRCNFLSQAWFEFTGQTAELGPGPSFLEAVHPEDRAALEEILHKEDSRHHGFRLEYRLRRHDGVYRTVIGAAAPRKTETGDFGGFIGSIIDITERKRAEDALREADMRKDEFLATLAHELRNPLAPLRNGLQVIARSRHDPEAISHAREMMERQLQQMVRLVDELLDVSRISRGTLQLRKERVELVTIIQSAVETSRPLIEAAGHEFLISIPREQILLDADTTRLAQVFTNLLANAAKFTPSHGRIEFTVRRRDLYVVVSVKDNGVGIPPRMLTNVFDMFRQVEGTAERPQTGLGIGLTIARRLVEMHGGSIEASSEGTGRGSEFTVRLPIANQAAFGGEGGPTAQPPLPNLEPPPPEPARVRRKVLVVDDNEDSALSMAMVLKIMGHDVRTAFDGVAALRVAEEFRPEVVLMDIGMPKLNGYDACHLLREQPWAGDILMVALTGWGQDEDRRRSFEAGFDQHLVKPVEPEEIKKLLAGLE